jgi:hypothetical protein
MPTIASALTVTALAVAATFTAALATIFTIAALAWALAAAFTIAALAATPRSIAALAVAALATAFVAATFTATAVTATAAFVTYDMAASVFEDEATRATGNRDGLAVTTPEFVSGRTSGGRRGNTDATAHFVAPRTMRGWDDTAVTTVKHVARWALRTILMEAGATTGVPSDAAGPCHRTTGAEHEKSNGEKCRQALPHERSLVL